MARDSLATTAFAKATVVKKNTKATKAMKPSGVAWLGDIPEGWEVDLIGSFYSQRNEKVSDRDYPPLSVTMKGVLPQLATVAKTDDGDNRKLVKKGDFAINSRSDRRGSCGISEYDGSVSLINTILMPRGEMEPRYYNWLFHTDVFADEFYKWGHGIVDDLWTTRWSEMKRIHIVRPPLPEQRAIADYLDEKCGAIDAAIAEAKNGIEECTAWKKSLIFEAVTGKRRVGVFNAEKQSCREAEKMKPSGIPWIGEIPEGWEVRRLKGVLARPLQYGASESGIGYNEALPRYIRITDITLDGKLKDEGALSLTEEAASDYILRDQDILLARSGATVGKAFLYEKQMGRAAFAGYLIRATVDVAKALPRFVYYTTLGCGYDDWRSSIAVSATIQNIGADKYNNYSLPIPPMKEQQAIADYLDEKCAAIDAMVTEKEKLITDLEAYKKSLIFELVTGKREVG